MAERNTIRALTTDELRANASNWTLAGDVGLLAHLQKFSEEIIEKAEAAEASLNNLLDRVEETTTNFNNVGNQFLSLQNSQFLENRVYDDETPTEENKPPQPHEGEETQQQTLMKYKEAVSIGLGLLDSHFEQVEVIESSDSDEEPSESEPAMLWRPKSQYTKPLPLVIGSAEWWADDSVGLGDYQENEDSEPEPSLSEGSETHAARPEIKKRLRLSPSSSSSEGTVSEPKRPTLPASMSASSYDKLHGMYEEPEDMFKPTEDLFGKYSKHEPLFGETRVSAPLFHREPVGDVGDLFGPSSNDIFADAPSSHLPKQSTEDSSKVFGSIQKSPAPVDKIVAKNAGYRNDLLAGRKKQDESFDDGDDGLFGSGDAAQVTPKPVSSIVSNAFTKELAAKLGTVVKNQDSDLLKTAEESVVPDHASQPPENKEKNAPASGLFGDDDDMLFGGGNKVSTVSVVRAKASNLFDDAPDDLFSSSQSKVKVASIEKKPEGSSYSNSGSRLKAGGKALDLFGGDLFSDDTEDDLFAPKKVTFPRMMLSSSDSRDESPVGVAGPKASTPAVQGTPAVAAAPTPSDDLFGGISRLGIGSASTTGDQSQLSDQSSVLEEGSSNDANIEDTHIESRDLGFIENSSLSDVNSNTAAANSKSSPASWFHPQMSSTRAVGASDETSGYRTGAVADSASVAVSGNANASANAVLENTAGDAKMPAKRVSSIAEEHVSTSRTPSATVGKSRHQDDLFSCKHSVKNAPNEEEEIEDLFSGISGPSRVSGKSLWHLADDDADDLFSDVPRVSATADVSVRANHSTRLNQHLPQKPAVSPHSSVVQNTSESKPKIETEPVGRMKSNVSDALENDDDLFASKLKRSTPHALSKVQEATPKVTEPDADKYTSAIRKFGDGDVINKSSQPKIVAKPTVAQSEDLFGGSNRAPGWKPSSLFDDDDDSSLFDSGRNKLPDNVSVSSSRSSLFDEPSLGKSTLPSIFENKTSQHKSGIKVSLFEDVDDEFDLFAKMSTPSNEEKINDSESNGSASINSVPKSKVKEVKESPVLEEKKGTETISSTGDLLGQNLSLGLNKAVENDDGDDLFRVLEGKKKPRKEVSSEQVDPRNKSDDTKKIDVTIKPSQVEPELVKAKPTPPSSLSIRKTTDLLADRDEADGEVIKVAVSKKIGKLSIPSSLKINPVALLPGAKLVKQTSRLENEVNTVPAGKDSAATSDESAALGAASPTDFSPAVSAGSSASGASVGESSGIAGQTLPSAVRGRARIPVKRRPQTRKARHEALRISGIDFGMAEPVSPGPSGSDRESSSSLFHTAENTPSPAFISPSPSNPISPSTDEEDYFNVPELDSNFEKEDQSIFKRDALSSSATGVEGDETLLFDGAPVISPTQARPETPTGVKNLPEKSVTSEHLFTTKRTSENFGKSLSEDENLVQPFETRNIFPSDDDLFSAVQSSHGISQVADDDLFGSSLSLPPDRKSHPVSLFSDNKIPIVPSKSSKSNLTKTTASIFEDSDDDDSIFSGNSSAPLVLKTSQTSVVSAPVPKPRVETVKEPFVDPLGLLLDGND